MADTPESLPLAEQPLEDQALLARAFWLLLDQGRPVEVGALADALQRAPAAVAAAVDRLEQAGLTRRDGAGRLLGSHGLSVVPTRHELMVDGKRYWTWCAYDAVGILGALAADGRVRSRSPHSGTLIELEFRGGRPDATEAVVFLAEGPCRSVIDDWCPLVNLFEDDQAATAWARQHGIAGATRPVAQATHAGAAAWRAYLWPGTTTAGCCPQDGRSTTLGGEEGTHGDQD